MYNDFVLIGPKSDPAGIKGMKILRRRLRHKGQGSNFHIARRPLWYPSRRTHALE